MFKTASLALAAVVASVSVAAADVNYISNFVEQQNNDTQVELGTVRAAGNGVVEVYSFHEGVVGDLIGSQSVTAGANLDVDVDIRRTGLDAVAFLKVDGQIVDTQELEFN